MNDKPTLDLQHEPLGRTLVIGDIHSAEGYRFLALTLVIRNEIFGKIDRVITMGDIDGETYKRLHGNEKDRGFDAAMKELGIPTYHIFGNHDEAWELYAKYEDAEAVREINQAEDPRLIGNERMIEFIDSMKSKIFLDGVLLQHAPFHPMKPWPARTAKSLLYSHMYMKNMEFPNMMVGHIHENFIHGEDESMSSYIMSKAGESRGPISLEVQDHIVGIGRFDEKGNVAILEQNDQEETQVTFHKLWRDPSAYY